MTLNLTPHAPPAIPPGALALAAEMIVFFEGIRLKPYRDAGYGVVTVGYGFTTLADGSPVTMQTPPLTLDECKAMLEAKLTREYMPGVLAACVGIKLTDNQLAALCDFAYNLGVSAVTRAGLPSRLRAGDVAGAAARMRPWNMGGGHVLQGLVNRRRLEAAVLLGSPWPVPDAAHHTSYMQRPSPRPASGPAGAGGVAIPQQSWAQDAQGDAETAALNEAELARVRAGG